MKIEKIRNKIPKEGKKKVGKDRRKKKKKRKKRKE